MSFIERVLGPEVRGFPIPNLDFRAAAEAGNESLVPSPVIIELDLCHLDAAEDVGLLRQECERKLAFVAMDRRIVGLVYVPPASGRPLSAACDAALNAVQGSVVAHTGAAPRFIVSWRPAIAPTPESERSLGAQSDGSVPYAAVAGTLALDKRRVAAATPRTQRSSLRALSEDDLAIAQFSRVLSDWFEADVVGVGPGAESRFGGDCFLNHVDAEAWRANLVRGGLGTHLTRMLTTAQRFVADLLAKLAAGRRIPATDVLRRRAGVPPPFARTCLAAFEALSATDALTATPRGYRLDIAQRRRFGEVVGLIAGLAATPPAVNVVPLLPRRERDR